MIIGFTGRKKSGKDTAGLYLINNFHLTHYKIATPLKDAAKAIFGWTDEYIEDPEIKEKVDERWGISPRVAMQYLGHEFLKDLGKVSPRFAEKTGTNLYVKRMVQYFQDHPKEDIVLTDVRFPAEVAAIHDAEGIVIRITRPSTQVFGDQHASESFYDTLNVDEDIVNDGSLDNLYAKLHNMYKRQRILGF
jgi:hypothetical protein